MNGEEPLPDEESSLLDVDPELVDGIFPNNVNEVLVDCEYFEKYVKAANDSKIAKRDEMGNLVVAKPDETEVTEKSDGISLESESVNLHYEEQSVICNGAPSEEILTPQNQQEQQIYYIVPNSLVTISSEAVSPHPCEKNSTNSNAEMPRLKTVFTVQDYRKQIGLKVHGQKPQEKIGIKLNQINSALPVAPSTPQPTRGAAEEKSEPDVPSPKGKGAVCQFCGFISALMNKCERCHRRFKPTSVKVVDFPSPSTAKTIAQSEQQTQPHQQQPVSKEIVSATSQRKPKQTVRQTRKKYEEPQCVTLSSDDEDGDNSMTNSELFDSNQPEAKRSKTESDPLSIEATACSSAGQTDESGLTPQVKEMDVGSTVQAQRTYQRIPISRELIPATADNSLPHESAAAVEMSSNEAEDEQQQPSETNVQEKQISDLELDLSKWKEVGLKGTFFAVTCRSARIGSYKVTPTDRVLFSSEGIMIEVPVLGPNRRASDETDKLVLFKNQILKMDVHFGKNIPAMFIYGTPSACREIRRKLRMGDDSSIPPWYDTGSRSEEEKRLTLLPDTLTDVAKNAIKQTFSALGVYNEISANDTNRLLMLSSPDEIQNIVQSTSVVCQPPSSLSVAVDPSLINRSTANKENGCKLDVSQVRTTRASSKASTPKTPQSSRTVPVVPMFSWSDGRDRFSVTTEDFACLNEDRLLNDSIIDFYLRYFSTKLEPEEKARCHVFSSFFYQRLTTRPAKQAGRKHPIEDDPKLTAPEKRHSRVKSWTKKVDIFDKDYLIIPINEHQHWFLAIVCFPGLAGPVSAKDNQPVNLPPVQHPERSKTKKVQRIPLNKLVTASGQSYTIGSTTITPVSSLPKTGKVNVIPVALTTEEANNDKDEAESDDESLSSDESADSPAAPTNAEEPIKQPCILVFDSLSGSARSRMVNTLRDYLEIEYQTKRPDSPTPYDKSIVKAVCLKVPQQNNYSDCGVYVLQYAESFMKKPLCDYRFPMPSLRNWFPAEVVARKRRDIQDLLIQLMVEMKGPEAEPLVQMLRPPGEAKAIRTYPSKEKQQLRPDPLAAVPPEIRLPPNTIVVAMVDISKVPAPLSPVVSTRRKTVVESTVAEAPRVESPSLEAEAAPVSSQSEAESPAQDDKMQVDP